MVKDAFNNGQESAVPIPAPGFRKAGVLLLLTAVATLAAVAGRVLADADQPTLLESLSAIAESRLAYGSGGLARVVSGISLAAAAALLWKSVTMRETPPMALALGLLVLSGVCAVLSGACSILLTVLAPASDALPIAPSASLEAIDVLRWVFGKAGFAAAGLALVAASRPQWQAGGVWRRLAPVTVVLGLAMLFIWVDAATLLHRISGPAFIIWLVAVAVLLLTGRSRGMFAGAANSS